MRNLWIKLVKRLCGQEVEEEEEEQRLQRRSAGYERSW